jgi:hypothetical protein
MLSQLAELVRAGSEAVQQQDKLFGIGLRESRWWQVGSTSGPSRTASGRRLAASNSCWLGWRAGGQGRHSISILKEHKPAWVRRCSTIMQASITTSSPPGGFGCCVFIDDA